MPDSRPHDLHTFMAQVTDLMASEYGRIYTKAARDPGTAGDEGEENWAVLLRDWLPPAYHVATKGQLIGADGTLSPQIDVVVLKPSYPVKLRDRRIWLAGGVAAVFECKTTVTTAHVTDSYIRCAKFKALFPPRIGNPRVELVSPLIYGLLAHEHVWKGKKSKPLEHMDKAIWDGIETLAEPRFDIDIICVANLATWTRSYFALGSAFAAGTAYVQQNGIDGTHDGPLTSTVKSAKGEKGQLPLYQPIGALLSALTKKIAVEDPAVRDIADYYQQVHLSGKGNGALKLWPFSVYSKEVQAQIRDGKLQSNKPWDDWSVRGPV